METDILSVFGRLADEIPMSESVTVESGTTAVVIESTAAGTGFISFGFSSL